MHIVGSVLGVGVTIGVGVDVGEGEIGKGVVEVGAGIGTTAGIIPGRFSAK
jgi:hypothetical protein